ncbi:MAG TPA: LysR substrate-binding domain-containing protein [Puia sp.]|nr:LysR substrate-binding domain-containing protein [Puia sp.]
MELRHLLYFKTVAEQLHFRKAAAKLFISQPPLSRQIKELEKELGVMLFTRKDKRVALTDAGKYFKTEVDAIFARLEESKITVRQIHNSESGELKIGYISSVYQSHLADVLIAMRGAFPFIKTNLFEMPTMSQVKALEQGSLDVGILRGPVQSDQLQVQTLFFDPFVVVIPATKTNFKQQEKLAAWLKTSPFIFFSKDNAPHYNDKLIEICARLRFKPDIVHEANNAHSILQLVEAGLGVSILPYSLKQQYSHLKVSFIELQNIPVTTEVVLAYKQNNKSAALKWFTHNFIHAMKAITPLLIFLFTSQLVCAQSPLITDIPGRHTVSLDGYWQYIADPYETGFYDYRYKELKETDPNAYWNTDIPANKSDKKEFGYTDEQRLRVPGDWNSQDPRWLYYEGTIWYKKSFDFTRHRPGDRIFLYFGAVNYRADVYLNGKKLGAHSGGFTPFDFEIPEGLLKPTGNYLVVKVDNKRYADEVPTLNTDWWNYGGITRSVMLVEVPPTFVEDYIIQLAPDSAAHIRGWVRLNDSPGISGQTTGKSGQAPAKSTQAAGKSTQAPGKSTQAPGDAASADAPTVTISIPELHLAQTFPARDNLASIDFSAPGIRRWSPDDPKRYRVIVTAGQDRTEEMIGFRTIQTRGTQLLLNGKPLFLRGVAMHEEIPQEGRRAYSRQDAAQLLGWARELGCNMVRLAHYPHDESMTRMADSLGILVWSEIPVYWTIDFGSKAVLAKAQQQLAEMITRDHNRASIIIWSVGNETPVSPVRTEFMHTLITTAKGLDSTRLISAALELNYNPGKNMHVVDDPLGQYVDLVAFNEYLGWYGGTPADCRNAQWSTIYDKPFYISETGAEALSGFHADSLTRWSEEWQAWYFREQVAMFRRMPPAFVGVSPWVLADFRSPKRNNPLYQKGWNNKGLIGHNGKKKKAFYIIQSYYKSLKH